MPRPSYRRPALVLAVITPCLTELLSGNIPAPKFILPWVFLFLLVIYGLPVLIIRDLWVRWNLSFPGLFLLGLAYGIYNEGVLAKTLLRDQGVPIDAFNHYALLGINWPWAFVIVPWHALHAVVYPITLITWLYPEARSQAWLTRREFALGSGFLLSAGALFHCINKEVVTSPLYLLFFLTLMAALVHLAWRMPRSRGFLGTGGVTGWSPVIAGFIFYPISVLGPAFLAGIKMPGVAICLVSLALFTMAYRFWAWRHWLPLSVFILWALGDYLAGSVFDLFLSYPRGGFLGVLGALALLAFLCRGISVGLRPRDAPTAGSGPLDRTT